MIAIGLGANLSSDHGTPRETLTHALEAFPEFAINVEAASSWYETAPVPASDQAWFVNRVVCVSTALEPYDLLNALLEIETRYGRIRRRRWEARTIDLDLLCYEALVIAPDAAGGLILPHPAMHERAFVLLPLREIAPDWIHPALGTHISDLVLGITERGLAAPDRVRVMNP